MSRPSLRVHLARHAEGLFTARLVARTATPESFVANGVDPEHALSLLEAELRQNDYDDLDRLAAFVWREEVRRAQVTVEVRPQTLVGKRPVIGKTRVPLDLTYWWAALEGDERTPSNSPAGFRVMLPRFDWWFVVEDLGMAAEVLRQAVSAELGGASGQSLFVFRSIPDERIVEWRPKWKESKQDVAASLRERFGTLQQVAEDWTRLARANKLGRHHPSAADEAMAPLLAAETKPSLLLVGPSGVGKTAWVRELARRMARGAEELDENSPRLWSTSVDRIMAGMQYLGMWEQRCLELTFELSDEGHFLYVDHLSGLARTQSGASSIADLLLPAIRDRSISLIAEATDEELSRLQVDMPALVAGFTLLRLTPPSTDAMLELLAAMDARGDTPRRMESDAGRRLIRHLDLFRRDYAFPGKLFQFLTWLEREAGSGSGSGPLSRVDVDAQFCRWSGLALELVSEDRRGDVQTLQGLLTEKVVGQDDACRASAEVLARFKAGVNHPDKPIGSLLFVGPTGVGKTELAKQLANVVFGSPDRMVRLDMSEYQFAGSVRRLLSDERESNSLAQRVARQPLCLLLLDEIEKAHPSVFDLLLGVLGEGRLTTEHGRRVDLRMTLVVMTSNLGSEISPLGFGSEAKPEGAALRAARDHFRPEFFNRLDRVVPFAALSAESLRRIVELELAAVSKREGLQRRAIVLDVSAEAKDLLAELGYSPQYGARPLRRVIEERVMAPIAAELSRRPSLRQLRASVTRNEDHLRVQLLDR
ncbi:MAG: AAA family ATPase [Polyangiaceae bacterium]